MRGFTYVGYIKHMENMAKKSYTVTVDEEHERRI